MKGTAVFFACVVLACPVIAIAQTPLDSGIVLIPLRSLDEIQADIADAKNRLSVAEARVPVVEGAEKQAQMQIDPWAKQIDLVKAKVDVARNEKNESAKTALEAEKNALERQKNLAENNHDLRKAETDLAKAHSEWIATQLRAWEFEQELAMKRIEREALVKSGTTTIGLAAVDQVVRNLERKALGAQKDEADKSGNRADKEKNIVSKRIKILETQDKIMTGQ